MKSIYPKDKFSDLENKTQQIQRMISGMQSKLK